jgi:hypothetical protein
MVFEFCTLQRSRVSIVYPRKETRRHAPLSRDANLRVVRKNKYLEMSVYDALAILRVFQAGP